MDLSMFSLDGKVALVTGASRGIGKAVSIGFAKAGAKVVLSSRKQADLDKVADEIRSLGGDALPIAGHAARPDEINNVVNTAVAKYGKIDILFNNAGTSPSVGPIIDADEKLWDSIMNLNLKGYWFMAKAVAKVMIERKKGGSIINCASVDAIRPEKYVGIYAISKAGVIMLTKVLANELAEYNIRVNSLCPGATKTKLLESSFAIWPEKVEEIKKHIPLGRMGEPDEMVGACVYMASDSASFLTGHEIIVDGGMLISE